MSLRHFDFHFTILKFFVVWPTNLVTCALFNTLHAQTYTGIGDRGGLSRERFFSYALVASTLWYFIPGYLFQALSYFSWVTWIAPNNIPVNEMFGYVHGMGMSLITFDWAQIAYIGSPLATPWWAEVNVLAGFIFFFCELFITLIFQHPILIMIENYFILGFLTPVFHVRTPIPLFK